LIKLCLEVILENYWREDFVKAFKSLHIVTYRAENNFVGLSKLCKMFELIATMSKLFCNIAHHAWDFRFVFN